MIIWDTTQFVTLQPEPPRDVRIMMLVAMIFGALLILAATIAPAFLQEAV